MSTEAPETGLCLELRLLGRPQLVQNGTDVVAEIGAKPLALIAYLAINAPDRVPRSKLAATFWTDKSEEASRYRLRHTLWELRKTLGRDQIQSNDSACWFSLDETTWVDVHSFLAGLQRCGVGTKSGPRISTDLASFSALLLLYRGELLEGLSVRDAPLFEEWLLVERERLQLLYLEGLWALAKAQTEASQLIEAIHTLGRLIEADPLRERSYRSLMQLHLRLGDRSSALRVYKQCAAALAAELGVSPSLKTQMLFEMISKGSPEAAMVHLQRAAELLQQQRYQEAKAACAAAEASASDLFVGSQIALLRAEIAMAEGRDSESLSLLRSARQALFRLMPKRK